MSPPDFLPIPTEDGEDPAHTAFRRLDGLMRATRGVIDGVTERIDDLRSVADGEIPHAEEAIDTPADTDEVVLAKTVFGMRERLKGNGSGTRAAILSAAAVIVVAAVARANTKRPD